MLEKGSSSLGIHVYSSLKWLCPMKRRLTDLAGMKLSPLRVTVVAILFITLGSASVEAIPQPISRSASSKQGTKSDSPSGSGAKPSRSSIVNLGSAPKRDEPVYVSSDKLAIDTEKREFVYSGNVKVVQGPVTINSEEMVGNYDADDKIERIVAKKNVTIFKEPDLRATSQAATYQAKTGIVTLTENPHLFQGGSDLAADKITIDLNTNKSSAEGQVRMKVIKSEQ